jgi:tRNA (guanine-N7-)-methyltransferase
LNNVAFLRTRIEFIDSFFSHDEVDEIWITFPDPHPGGRNSDKRLTSPRFLNIYRLFMKNKGLVHLKTDNIEIYNYTKKVVENNTIEMVCATNDLYSRNFDVDIISDDILSIRTHYEKIFLEEGLKINFLSFRLEKEKIIEDASRKAKEK